MSHNSRLSNGPQALDEWRNAQSDVRIAVTCWVTWERVLNQFIVRRRDIRMVWHYLKRVGLRAVFQKIRSRLGEVERNVKVAGFGTGVLLQVPEGSQLEPGRRVIFFAPNHSMTRARLSLDAGLVQTLAPQAALLPAESSFEFPDTIRPVIGWSPYSGVPLDVTLVQRELRRLVASTSLAVVQAGEVSVAATSAPAHSEYRVAVPTPKGKPTAILFGLGNYAKTQLIPNVRKHLQLVEVHELDPDQIESASEFDATLDTSPWPRGDGQYDAWFIAGYHHTHADLAIRALESGAYAVVEKPLATTAAQYAALRRALDLYGERRLFTCLQKRYSLLDKLARIDLGVPAGEPIDMQSIVYEIPLPARHWYNWPNSGSRLISNGCHWLDYFLHVNEYSPVRDRYVRPLRGHDLVVSVELENDARLSLCLTDTGSERLGVRDLIDLRARDVTVRMVDATFYEAESSSRMLRRRRVNPLNAYARMYDTICGRIVAGEGGDALRTLRSTVLMLDLEEELARRST